VAAGGAGASSAFYDVDPDTIAALVLACPAVAGLSAGPFGAAATYLVGRKVAGIRITPDTVEVHVVARFGPTVGELAGQVRSALAGRVLGRTVDIVVEDLADPTDVQGTAGAAGTSSATDDVMTTSLGGTPVVLPPPSSLPAALPSRWTRPDRQG